MENEKLRELINQGIALGSTGNYEKAKEYFKEAIKEDNRCIEAYSRLGNACANLEQYDEALAAFEKVRLIDVNDAENYFNIGNVYILKNDLLKAIENYNKAEEKGFENVELYANLAGMYREMEQLQPAIRNLTKAIKKAPLRGDIRVEKAAVYIQMGKFNEALETLEELQKIIPDAFEAYDLQTQIYCGLGKHEKALEIINYATARFENDLALQWIKIKILVEMACFDEANQEIADIKQKEGFEYIARDVYMQESIIHSTNGDLEKAMCSLENALKSENETVDEQVRYLLMNLYVPMKKYEEALAVAKVLQDTNSETVFSTSAMYYIPYIWKLQGKEDEAKARFKELVGIFRKLSIKHPNYYEIYMYRVLCHNEVGEYEKALELTDFIESMYPEKFDAHALRYTIYTAMGEKEKAEESRAKAKAMNPNLNI